MKERWVIEVEGERREVESWQEARLIMLLSLERGAKRVVARRVVEYSMPEKFFQKLSSLARRLFKRPPKPIPVTLEEVEWALEPEEEEEEWWEGA